MLVTHPFGPLFDEHARVLILGSMASKASRDSGFYYGHPRNKFWPLMAVLFGEPTPTDVDAKRALLQKNGVALWDVLHTCDIEGSADATIGSPSPHDLTPLFAACSGLRVFANGQTAAELYRTLVYPDIGVPITKLPSTSPANAAWPLERLKEAWKKIL